MTCSAQNDHRKRPTPLQAIRRKCLDCCLGSPQEVRCCEADYCSLHPYRFGRYPGRRPPSWHEES